MKPVSLSKDFRIWSFSQPQGQSDFKHPKRYRRLSLYGFLVQGIDISIYIQREECVQEETKVVDQVVILREDEFQAMQDKGKGRDSP